MAAESFRRVPGSGGWFDGIDLRGVEMSDHVHDEHASHDGHGDSHGGLDSHSSGHDDHDGHGDHVQDDHGHGGGAGDYNTLPPGPSTLPPVPVWGLAIMAVVLVLLMTTLVNRSLGLADAGGHGGHGESHDAATEAHGGHEEKKAEH